MLLNMFSSIFVLKQIKIHCFIDPIQKNKLKKTYNTKLDLISNRKMKTMFLWNEPKSQRLTLTFFPMKE